VRDEDVSPKKQFRGREPVALEELYVTRHPRSKETKGTSWASSFNGTAREPNELAVDACESSTAKALRELAGVGTRKPREVECELASTAPITSATQTTTMDATTRTRRRAMHAGY
jgi:hypothetical protein